MIANSRWHLAIVLLFGSTAVFLLPPQSSPENLTRSTCAQHATCATPFQHPANAALQQRELWPAHNPNTYAIAVFAILVFVVADYTRPRQRKYQSFILFGSYRV